MSTQRVINKDLLLKAGTPITLTSTLVEVDGTKTTEHSNTVVLLGEDVFVTRWTPERKIVVHDVPRDTTKAWFIIAVWSALWIGFQLHALIQ